MSIPFGLGPGRRGLIGWFGIRGIGSVVYLMFAIDHGLDDSLANDLLSLSRWSP